MAITISSNDGQLFDITRDVLSMLGTLDNCFVSCGCENDPDKPVEVLPCPNVNGKILKIVVDFCHHHILYTKMSGEYMEKVNKEFPISLSDWDESFLPKDEDTLREVQEAANYLHVQKLIDASARSLAELLEWKSIFERIPSPIEEPYIPQAYLVPGCTLLQPD